jgi:hypothetical protein
MYVTQPNWCFCVQIIDSLVVSSFLFLSPASLYLTNLGVEGHSYM